MIEPPPTPSSPPGPSDREVARGLGLNLVAYGAKSVLHFGIGVGLARLLSPSAFGVIAMVLLFSQLALLLADAGLRTALVQKPRLEPAHLATAFWASLGGGAALSILFWLAAPGVARLFDQDELVPLARAVGLAFPLASLAVVPAALLSRRLAVVRMAAAEIAGIVAGGGAGLLLALRGAGAWSLAVQVVTTIGVESALLLALSGWSPALRWSRAALAELLPVSASFLGFSVFTYAIAHADHALIGRYAGAPALGLYVRAWALTLLPVLHLSRVVGAVMFPALARCHDDPARARELYLRALRALSLISLPASIGLAVTAEELVLTVFGEAWRGLVPLLHVLSVVGVTRGLGVTVNWIFQAQGRTDILLRWALWSSLPTVLAFVIGIRWGAYGVAVGYAIRSLLLVYPTHAIPGRLIGLRVAEVARTIRGIFLCAAAMGLVVLALRPFLAPLAYGARLAVGVAAGVVVYGLLLRLLRPADLAEALGLFRISGRTSPGVPEPVLAATEERESLLP